MQADEVCPCGGARYALCCGRFHAGPSHLRAPQPELLMRSRYSAYVLGLEAYLLATWHASTRPQTLSGLHDGSKWLGLSVKRAWRSEMQPETEGFVEFVARCKPPGGGPAIRLHEQSRFVKEAGHWFYVDAMDNTG